MNKFKVGDKVICVKANLSIGVHAGLVYTITIVDDPIDNDPSYVKVKGIAEFLSAARFKLYEPRIKRNLPSWF
jgi:hypothetical protein